MLFSITDLAYKWNGQLKYVKKNVDDPNNLYKIDIKYNSLMKKKVYY